MLKQTIDSAIFSVHGLFDILCSIEHYYLVFARDSTDILSSREQLIPRYLVFARNSIAILCSSEKLIPRYLAFARYLILCALSNTTI